MMTAGNLGAAVLFNTFDKVAGWESLASH